MHDGELPGAAGQRYQPMSGLSVGGWSLAFVGLFVANEQAQRVIGVGLGHAVFIEIKLPCPSEGSPRRFFHEGGVGQQQSLAHGRGSLRFVHSSVSNKSVSNNKAVLRKRQPPWEPSDAFGIGPSWFFVAPAIDWSAWMGAPILF